MSTFTPKKRLGQVFLKNKTFLQKIIKAAEIKLGDLVLEIGPGTGVLTEALLQAEAKVIAIEKDPKMINFLQKKFKDNSQLILIQADIRDFLKTNQFYTQYSILNTQYKVLGNIPYYLTSHLLRLLLENPIKPSLIVLMIQKEVAQRIIAQAPKMNLLSASVQFYAKPEIICYVGKTAFWPKPKVDSAVIKITPINTSENTDKTLINNFFKVVKAGFSQPRKFVLNNLSRNLKMSKQKIEEISSQLNLNPKSRSQNLNLKDWISLSCKIYK